MSVVADGKPPMGLPKKGHELGSCWVMIPSEDFTDVTLVSQDTDDHYDHDDQK